MKKFYMLFAMVLSISAIDAQTLFTYGSNNVSKDEFLRAYNKNSVPVTDKEKALREYLELYSNFKLKVKAAEELRLDTLPQIQTDISNFRHQVEENYMNDEKGVARLVDEAYDRSLKDLHVLHFSVMIDAKGKIEDTMKDYQNIFDAARAIHSDEKDYRGIAEKNKIKFSDLGFITVFSVPYEYENIIYSLKPGQASQPYRSKNGWHVFKVIEERKSIGKWKVAQILFTYPPEAGQDDRQAVAKRADSVYNLLKNGADFSKLANDFSDDKLSYMTGGELPEFGTGKYDHVFEEQVFKLKMDGELTKPFVTPFGIHIVKKLSSSEMPAQKDNAAFQYDLKQKILQDSRINSAKEKFSKDIITLIGYKRNATVTNEQLFRDADSVMKNLSNGNTKKYAVSNKIIINFKNGVVKGSDWLMFIKEYKANTELYKNESNEELWKKFTDISALDYYKKNLASYNADFKYQMKEFKEGNMLFEIMERNVWSKAASDTVGLLEYYNANKKKYKWAESADVLMVNASDEKSAMSAMEAIKQGKSWKQISEESNGQVQADSGRYELAQIMGNANRDSIMPNRFSPVVKNTDGSAAFVKYLKLYPADQQRNFEEAKGLVINDYQNVLEKKWLTSLHKKYPVKINEAVVKQMLN